MDCNARTVSLEHIRYRIKRQLLGHKTNPLYIPIFNVPGPLNGCFLRISNQAFSSWLLCKPFTFFLTQSDAVSEITAHMWQTIDWQVCPYLITHFTSSKKTQGVIYYTLYPRSSRWYCWPLAHSGTWDNPSSPTFSMSSLGQSSLGLLCVR